MSGYRNKPGPSKQNAAPLAPGAGKPSFWQKRRNRWLVIGGGSIAVIIIAVLVTIFVFIQNKPPDTRPTYPDVAVDNPDYDAVVSMIGYGLMETQANGLFKSGQALTRAEFAALVSEVFRLGSNLPIKPSYTDVLPNHPQYAAVEATRDLFGYRENQDNQVFDPDKPVLHGTAVAALTRALALEPNKSTLADAIRLPADDPILTSDGEPLTRIDAARLFQSLIISRLPSPAPTFQAIGIR